MSKPTSITILPDVAPCYLVDSKTQWSDFKKALRQTAMTWGFRQWFNTTVLGGPKWNGVAALGVIAKDENGNEIEIESETPDGNGAKAEEDAQEEEEEVEEKLSEKIMKIMGYSESEVDYFQASTRFVNVLTGVVESNKEGLARQKLWHWMLKSLHGPQTTPGPFHYLADEVTHMDVAALYQQLIRVIDTPTMVSQADELAAVFFYKFDSKSQDIFHYYGEVKKLVRRVHDLNAHLPKECHINLPDTIVRALLLRAMRLVPLYKTVLDQFIIKSPDQWKTFSADDLYKHLEQVSANSRGVSQKSTTSNLNVEGGVQANAAKVKNKESICFAFRDNGVCNRKNCKFSHETKKVDSSTNASATSKPADPSANVPPSHCDKCGENHKTRACKFTGKCNHCGILGHKEEVCRKKKSGGPKAMHLNADGTAVVSNLVVVQDDSPAQANLLFADHGGVTQALATNVPNGYACERFFADTGANRHIYPNHKSAAASFHRQKIPIGTAQGNKTMTSDGVGSMILYTSSGEPFPGFSRVIFSKQASCKLASVGELCDAGLVCIFYRDRLETYKTEDLNLSGKLFSCDLRDPKNRLYPLQLSRKIGEKEKHSAAVASGGDGQWGSFPDQIPDELGQAFLAKSYIKDGLSEIDRYHAKLGDIGVKAMRKALPDLKIPDKYRCVCCIEGKVHKFNHKQCGEGERTEYEPGVCIHADHSGPYVRSLGGHVYSELFIDRGSGYLWGVRMAKKTGHYEAAPRVFADARAASGRRLQYFQSDGDGVFTAAETDQLLQKFKVRHLYGAPYDSDTNPFIERARRTVFEGTCTSLLRSGAPPSFWGEAENHKIFTINVLPSFPDPDNPGVFLSRKNLLEGNKRKFNLNHLMAFGTAATCYIPAPTRPGGKTPSQRRYFRGAIIGYEDHTPAYRIWDFDAQTVRVVSYNFTIAHEGFYPFKDKSWLGKSSPLLFYPTSEALQDTSHWAAFDFDEEDAKEAISQVKPPSADLSVPLVPAPSPPSPIVLVDEKTPISDSDSDIATEDTMPLRRSTRVRRPPPEHMDYNHPRILPTSNLLNVSDPGDKPVSVPPPKTLREAKLSPWWPQYKKGTEEEISGLERNQTWDLVPITEVPKGKNIIRGKFVFDDKRGQDGKVLRFKARFVAMGFTQKAGMDYAETFAGVVISKTFRIMLVILNEDPSYEMDHWDVKLAFTKAPIEEELYMYQPEGFEKNEGSTLYVCRLKKSLYGLKQSAHNWQKFAASIFLELGFTTLHTDSCLYYLKQDDAWCLVATHVDDIFPLYNQAGRVYRDSLFKLFEKYVEIGNLGPVSWALKTLIQRDREEGIIKISQEQFTKDFVSSLEIVGSSVQIPAVASGNDVHMTDQDNLDDEVKDYPFQSDIGSMWWLANISRPDIFFAVHRCSVWQNRPSRKLWRWLQQIKKYLAGSTSLGLVYKRSANSTPLLSGFADGAFASEDEVKSRIGWFFLVKGNLVSWASANPKRILTSSTEVECCGLSQFARENLWQRQLQMELGLFEVHAPTTVYEDNTASISMATNPGVPHKRSKHFGIEWAMFKEAVANGEIIPVHLPTEEQPADMLTKGLPPTKFILFRDRVMGNDTLQNHFHTNIPETSSCGNLK
jgi:hypothetical protein